VTGAGELEHQAYCGGIEVHSVMEEVLHEVVAGRPIDVAAALGDGVESAVESFGKVGNGAAEMAEHPVDSGKSVDHATEHELGGRKGCVHGKPYERHQPLPFPRFHTYGMNRMTEEHGAAIVGGLVQAPELLVGEGDSVHVAEQQRARQSQLVGRALEFLDGRSWIVERRRSQCNEALARPHDLGKRIVDESGQLDVTAARPPDNPKERKGSSSTGLREVRVSAPNVAHGRGVAVRALSLREHAPTWLLLAARLLQGGVNSNVTFACARWVSAVNAHSYANNAARQRQISKFFARRGGQYYLDSTRSWRSQAGSLSYGSAKGVNIVPVRVHDSECDFSEGSIIDGLDWIAQNASGPSVVNISLRIAHEPWPDPCCGDLDDAVEAMVWDEGIPRRRRGRER
jgi:hypothetical protein